MTAGDDPPRGPLRLRFVIRPDARSTRLASGSVREWVARGPWCDAALPGGEVRLNRRQALGGAPVAGVAAEATPSSARAVGAPYHGRGIRQFRIETAILEVRTRPPTVQRLTIESSAKHVLALGRTSSLRWRVQDGDSCFLLTGRWP